MDETPITAAPHPMPHNAIVQMDGVWTDGQREVFEAVMAQHATGRNVRILVLTIEPPFSNPAIADEIRLTEPGTETPE